MHAPVEAAAPNTLRVPPRSPLQSSLDNPRRSLLSTLARPPFTSVSLSPSSHSGASPFHTPLPLSDAPDGPGELHPAQPNHALVPPLQARVQPALEGIAAEVVQSAHRPFFLPLSLSLSPCARAGADTAACVVGPLRQSSPQSSCWQLSSSSQSFPNPCKIRSTTPPRP